RRPGGLASGRRSTASAPADRRREAKPPADDAWQGASVCQRPTMSANSSGETMRTPRSTALVYLLLPLSAQTSSDVVLDTEDAARPPFDSMSSLTSLRDRPSRRVPFMEPVTTTFIPASGAAPAAAAASSTSDSTVSVTPVAPKIGRAHV